MGGFFKGLKSAKFLVQLARIAFLAGWAGAAARGDVDGVVTIQGTPKSKDESFYARANGCGDSPIRHTENWKIGPKGELADVVVWIVEPQLASPLVLGRPELPPTRINQQGCRYEPHVVGETAGVPFKIADLDPTLHNILAKVYNGPGQPPGEDVFNFGQSYQGQRPSVDAGVGAGFSASGRRLQIFCRFGQGGQFFDRGRRGFEGWRL
jgi:hypothetical protein